MQVAPGSTDQSVTLYIVDSGDGTPEQGVTSVTAGLNLWYRREGEAIVNLASISDLTLLTDAHTDEGMLHIDDGQYRVDWPDAAFAAGVPRVQLGGAVTGMVVLPVYVDLTPNTANAGADPIVLTLTDIATTDPIPDAQIWVTSDAGGSSVVDGLWTSNSSGEVTVLLDAGSTYYFWAQKDGMKSVQGTSFVADVAGNAFTASTSVAGSSFSVLSIVNQALIELGRDPLVSLLDNNETARNADALYDICRREVLQDFDWQAATDFATLAQTADTPKWAYTYTYQLPANFLKLTEKESLRIGHQLLGNKIVSNESTLRIQYIYDLDDPSLMDQQLKSAIAARLALGLARRLTLSNQTLGAMAQLYQQRLDQAKYASASQSHPRRVKDDEWERSRFGFEEEPLRDWTT